MREWEVIEIVGPHAGSSLDYSTKEMMNTEQTMELIRETRRHVLFTRGCEAYRKAFPDSTATDEQVATHVKKIVDEYLEERL